MKYPDKFKEQNPDWKIQESGLKKIQNLDAKLAEQLGDFIVRAQEERGLAAKAKARQILTDDAKFTEEELGMFAIFDKEQ